MGSQLGLQLLHAIARSKISIPVLSESHASSEWCLRELVQMVENRKNKKNTRHLTGRLGEAFHSHKMYFEQRDVAAGQRALRDVSFLKGWESEKIANGFVISSPSKLFDFLYLRSCCCISKFLIGRIEI